jgi:HNH endonuclease
MDGARAAVWLKMKSLLTMGERQESHEQWRVSPTLPEYLVSSMGRVMRVPHRELLPNGGLRQYGGDPHNGADSGEGRMTLQFKGKTYKVHRLVCEAFNGPPPKHRNVCMHKDEDYRNNRPTNLKWGSQKENLNAPGFLRYCRGRTGENSPTRKARR